MRRLAPYLASLVLALLLAACAVSAPEPSAVTVLRDGKFELRDYPALGIAEVTVEGGQWGAANRGFNILAGYIFGANQTSRKIEMTAPVLQFPEAVLSERAEGQRWVVRFIMPAGLSPDTLPAPSDTRIRLLELPPTRMAALRFSGWALPFIVRGEQQRLATWIAGRGLAATGPVQLAQYDPPWTIWFLRRNDILVPVTR